MTKQSFKSDYNYLQTLPGVARIILKEYAQADEERRRELRWRNADLDLDKMLEEMEKQDANKR
jgi:hypothetical protein